MQCVGQAKSGGWAAACRRSFRSGEVPAVDGDDSLTAFGMVRFLPCRQKRYSTVFLRLSGPHRPTQAGMLIPTFGASYNHWRRWGSNPRPADCEPAALPTELRPRSRQQYTNPTRVCEVDFTRPRPRVSRASRPRVTRASRPPTRWGSVPSGLRPSLPTACRGRPARQQGGAPSRRDCAPAYRLHVAGILPANKVGLRPGGTAPQPTDCMSRASRPPTRWGSVPSGLRPSLPTACRGHLARA